MKKFFYLLLVVMLVASGKNYGRSSNPTDDPSGLGTLKINVDGVSFKMIKVEGGTFQMGSENGSEDEQPIHSVTLSDYYIGETEVTQALWQAVMGSNPSWFKGDNLPVETVRWNDCQEFISKLNQKTGRRFALPTEAQWEFAARGGNKSRGYEYSGSNNIDDVAWYIGNSSEQTHPVGTKMANELGLYDMTGNVWEWCSDWYGDYSSSSQTNPTGPSTGSHCVYRGGSWNFVASFCRFTCRFSNSPGYRDYYLGLRLVLLDGQPEEPQIEATVTIQSDKAVLNVNGIIANLVKVEGETFQMGSENGENYEKPVHSVTLSDYFIGETEVTQELWQAVMGSNPSEFKGDNLPVEWVNWEDCQKFISKLNQKTGRRFALPTEAQWEFAARGGNKSRGYEYSGSNNIDDVAWYGDNSSRQTHPVGTKMANELGLYDMSGNVLEWCSDWYGSYSSSSQTDPVGPSTGSYRVIRGGSWLNSANRCRSTLRSDDDPADSFRNFGFRLVLLDGQPEEPQIEATVTIQSDKAVLNVNGIIANLVKVEGGTFQMGSENGEEDEQPIHSVTLSDYYIGETEVTQALWQAVMGSNSNPSYFQGDNLPVEQVNWVDCQEFISKLNQKTGKTFALPTEAQWEFAARGGNKSQGYEYSGSNSVGDVAWYRDNSSGHLHPVGTKMANELGLYDMTGNVYEWCSDWYGDYSSLSQTDPTGPSTGSDRVLRGGCWFIRDCCSTFRASDDSVSRVGLYGLRLVLLDGQPEEPQIEATVTIQSDKAVLNVNGIIANLVKVKGGTFQMGSENGDEDEQPIHSVTLSGYYIGETEVTQALWQAVMGSNPSWFKGDNLPVESVSWDDCQEFISKLNQKTGRRFALPTEAQWEFAARGGNKSRGYEYSGSNNIDDVAWYWDNSSGQTHPVGTKMANELGLYDMSGNVLEWCSDWHDSYSSSSSQTDPVGPSTGSGRVYRGGGWYRDAGYCRSSDRNDFSPDGRNGSLGLRLVLLF